MAGICGVSVVAQFVERAAGGGYTLLSGCLFAFSSVRTGAECVVSVIGGNMARGCDLVRQDRRDDTFRLVVASSQLVKLGLVTRRD